MKIQFICAAAVVIAASVLGPSPVHAQLNGHNTTTTSWPFRPMPYTLLAGGR